jgi:acyl carrier protein
MHIDEKRHERTTAEVSSWLRTKVATMVAVPVDAIDEESEFVSYGLDSAAAVELLAELELWLDRQLDPRLVWDYPTIRALANALTKPPA